MLKLYLVIILLLLGTFMMDAAIEGMILHRPPGIIAQTLLVLLITWVVTGGIAVVLS